MVHIVEAVLQADAARRHLAPVKLTGPQRVPLTLARLPDAAIDGAVISQDNLAVDWLRDEDGAGWALLQPGPAKRMPCVGVLPSSGLFAT